MGNSISISHYHEKVIYGRVPVNRVVFDKFAWYLNVNAICEAFPDRSYSEWLGTRAFAKAADEAVAYAGVPLCDLFREVNLGDSFEVCRKKRSHGEPSLLEHVDVVAETISTAGIQINGTYIHPFLVYSLIDYLGPDLADQVNQIVVEERYRRGWMPQFAKCWTRAFLHHRASLMREEARARSTPTSRVVTKSDCLIEIEPLDHWETGVEALLSQMESIYDETKPPALHLILVIPDQSDLEQLTAAETRCREHGIVLDYHYFTAAVLDDLVDSPGFEFDLPIPVIPLKLKLEELD